ncbi:PIN domain-containing protein [Sphingomonas sp. MMS24-JH45]
MILLDTHVIVWMVDDNRRLGTEAVALIDDPAILLAITAWELSMLVAKSKLILTRPPRAACFRPSSNSPAFAKSRWIAISHTTQAKWIGRAGIRPIA